ncbi:MAG: flagellar filament capping protein FliD [Anaerobacillus sp.]|uniref:flagellar filament capping protein FliD n=1 Tax=Anaerobacillus sp. TaxID=1872506 RepID=UPI00391DE648
MRIGGIASGLDTESIIKNLMKVERLPLDRFTQRKTRLEWQRDAYRDMNLLFKNLDDAASNIRLRSSINTRQAASSNESVLTATANASVRNGSYEVEVTKVAKAERYMSYETIMDTDGSKLDPAKSFQKQMGLEGVSNTFTISTNKKDKDGNLLPPTSFTIDNKSLNDILKDINASGLGINARYDTVFGRVIIEKTETGIHNQEPNGQEIMLAGEFFAKLNVNTDVNSKPNHKAQDAEFIFKNKSLGLSETITSKTNRNTVGGITVNLQEVGTTNITITSNTDDAFNKIKSFVEKYNETIDTIRSKLNEPTHRGFPPLTDEQRRELTEREAELWDEKAKSGLLRRDQNLTSALSQMRLDLYSPVTNSGQFNQLAQIGIKTSSNYLEGGKLEIDEEKLRAALADDPDAVHQLLNNAADPDLTKKPIGERTREEMQTIYNQTGLIGRLRNSVSESIKKIVARAGNENRTNQQFTLGRELLNVDQQIDRFQRRLVDIESRHWAKFTAMEKAMNQANAQGMAFMNQIMGAGNF